jgi:glycosyltransferase involved in cell wall biosynthesis
VPRVRFLIVGRRPHRLVGALRRQGAIEVAADVPDVRPYLAQGHVAVVPLRIARGIQNKVLEAMAMGLPVVTLPGPAQGIEARDGADWFVEHTAEAFASRVARLLTASTERMRVGRQARQLIEEHYAWRQILPRVETLVAAAGSVEPERYAVTAHGAIQTNGDRARTGGVHHA